MRKFYLLKVNLAEMNTSLGWILRLVYPVGVVQSLKLIHLKLPGPLLVGSQSNLISSLLFIHIQFYVMPLMLGKDDFSHN